MKSASSRRPPRQGNAMILSPQLPLPVLIDLCRSLRHCLTAGLKLLDAFQQQSRRGPAPLRPVAGRIALVLQEGKSLKQALKKERDLFPPLFLAMAGIGEETGMLPEVFGELEKFYIRQQQLRRDFRKQISWPVIQLTLAIFTIAGLIFILGLLPASPLPNQQRYDPLGLGLFGPSGALIFLAAVAGVVSACVGGFWLVRRMFRTKPWADSVALGLPLVGPCLRTLALGRFCLALRLTTETGMSIIEAMRLSLRATSNNAFMAWTPVIQSALHDGQALTASLAQCPLFPEEFLAVMTVAEESGQLAEVLRHQGTHYDEEAGRKLAALTAALGYGVWVLVGIIIIFAIFRIFGSYLSILNGLLP